MSDFRDKPVTKGGLGFSGSVASIVLITAVLSLVLLLQRSGQHGNTAD